MDCDFYYQLVTVEPLHPGLWCLLSWFAAPLKSQPLPLDVAGKMGVKAFGPGFKGSSGQDLRFDSRSVGLGLQFV